MTHPLITCALCKILLVIRDNIELISLSTPQVLQGELLGAETDLLLLPVPELGLVVHSVPVHGRLVSLGRKDHSKLVRFSFQSVLFKVFNPYKK